MHLLIILTIVSMGLALLWELFYLWFQSNLDKVNQGKGIQIPISYVIKTFVKAGFTFTIAYVLGSIDFGAKHILLVSPLLLVVLCLFLSIAIFANLFFPKRTNNAN